MAAEAEGKAGSIPVPSEGHLSRPRPGQATSSQLLAQLPVSFLCAQTSYQDLQPLVAWSLVASLSPGSRARPDHPVPPSFSLAGGVSCHRNGLASPTEAPGQQEAKVPLPGNFLGISTSENELQHRVSERLPDCLGGKHPGLQRPPPQGGLLRSGVHHVVPPVLLPKPRLLKVLLTPGLSPPGSQHGATADLAQVCRAPPPVTVLREPQVHGRTRSLLSTHRLPPRGVSRTLSLRSKIKGGPVWHL